MKSKIFSYKAKGIVPEPVINLKLSKNFDRKELLSQVLKKY